MPKVELEHFQELSIEGLSPRLLICLQALRYISGVPIHVTSALRAGDSDSAHALGLAVDISDNMTGAPVSSQWRHRILSALYGMGISRIGIYDRHIHFDLASAPFPQEVSWWKTSD